MTLSQSCRNTLLLITSMLTLIACDIGPVAVGQWEISYDQRDNYDGEIWTITDQDLLHLDDGETQLTIPIDLAGSRMSWAYDSQGDDSVSFAGSVDGNRFAGTLYTQQGNRSVYGQRRRTD